MLLENLSPELRKTLRQIKRQTLALQSIRNLNKIQKLVWLEMASHQTGIKVDRICCINKPINVTVFHVGDSKSSVLLCNYHSKQKYFLKDIFEVKPLNGNLVDSHTM